MQDKSNCCLGMFVSAVVLLVLWRIDKHELSSSLFSWQLLAYWALWIGIKSRASPIVSIID